MLIFWTIVILLMVIGDNDSAIDSNVHKIFLCVVVKQYLQPNQLLL